ncbi:YgiQ family radical SAM protein [Helicovermis profundi]|uniref:YgiQ family radical SAM protein n=1 Tax=Helicovermis profundi TaxID=3065157 RepID=A0AAU9EHI0_9FIRM|nr:YgiQ family radical SAM protein [Clostridia bacterium S502]
MIINDFLPVCKEDMVKLGWDRLDFVLVTGDAYVDHPSFGPAIISRVLVNAGYKVGIISQPNWKDKDSIKVLGRPRLGFLVAAGNIDSMVNHYTVSKRLREKDFYSPGGKMGLRPNRATIVYSNMVRRAYKKTPIILGGVEASLRRFAHYDYWDNKVRRSILVDADADMLIFGMGERQVIELANYLNEGIDIKYIRHIPGTCFLIENKEEIYDYVEIESFEEVLEDKIKYAKAFKVQNDEQDPIRGKVVIQKHKNMYLVQNTPVMPLSRIELDDVYDLPFQRDFHPMYKGMGGIPAITEVKNSIISERGCFGGCSFCALTFHQGRIIQSRSHESILKEADRIIADKDFKGYINDVGGPTANFRHVSCKKQLKLGTCKDKQCLYPEPCKNLIIDHTDLMELLRKIREKDKIKKVFVRSGLRYDYIMADKNHEKFLTEFSKHHVSGQLKVAPEHIADEVLDLMGKPAGKIYGKFVKEFYDVNKKIDKEQYIVPYLMSSHPGSTLKSAIKLAEYLRDIKYQPKQVQDFYPTPGTLSTCMFYTGIDPRTMKKVYVPVTFEEKALQRALLQFGNPRNYNKVYDALIKAGREDLIGDGEKCLIRNKGDRKYSYGKNNRKTYSKKTNEGNAKNKSKKDLKFYKSKKK